MKRSIFLILVLSVSQYCFSQSNIDSAYSLFRTIDWTEWHNIDTNDCRAIEKKHVTRQKYSSFFDKLLCPGVAKDTVVKYLGVGGNFEYSGDRKGWKGKAKDKHKIENSYCLVYDCEHKEWISRILISYKNGKVVRYTRGVIYY